MTLCYLNDSLIDDVQSIADSRFGNGYISRSDLTREDAIVLVALKNHCVVGFVLFYIVPENLFPLELNALFRQNYSSVYVKSIAVQSSCERNGYATALLLMVINIARRQNAACCYGYLWDSGMNIPANGIFRSLGFRTVKELPCFWYNDSIARGFECPVCGHPCHCKAMLTCRSLVKQVNL